MFILEWLPLRDPGVTTEFMNFATTLKWDRMWLFDGNSNIQLESTSQPTTAELIHHTSSRTMGTHAILHPRFVLFYQMYLLYVSGLIKVSSICYNWPEDFVTK